MLKGKEVALVAGEFLWTSRWNAMERAEMVLFVQNECAVTEKQANEVIVYALALAFLGENSTEPTQLQGVPKPPRQR